MNFPISKAAIIEQLRGHVAFGQLSDATLTILAESSDLLHFAPKAALMQQGEASDSAFFILAGEADILVETAYGQVSIARGTPHMLIGEIGAFSDFPRIASVRAHTSVEALRIKRELLLELGRTSPQLLLFVISQLGGRLSRLNRAIGFYANALTALERNDFDPKLLDDLLSPMPELVDFSQSFLRLAEQITFKRRHLEEMANAAAIQRSMLPPPFKADNGFAAVDLYGELRPAREVGGDFFDYFTIDERKLAISIGDVSGKGVPASLFMAMVQSLVRIMVREGGDLGSALTRVNNLLAAHNEESMFATVFCAVIGVDTGDVIYCNCGHNAPLLLRRGGVMERLTPTAPPLAASTRPSLRTATLQLGVGDYLVGFSDGLPEAINARGEFFGDQRVEQAVREHAKTGARDLIRGILERMADFVGSALPYDDIACLGLVFRGSEA
jgi:serine phosphatase RsbU (regulator of sigma subunit)